MLERLKVEELNVVLSTSERYIPGAMVALVRGGFSAKLVIKNVGRTLNITKKTLL